ncbi:MAG: hypothetical protein U0935_02220 [Pirellulales bacterium]
MFALVARQGTSGVSVTGRRFTLQPPLAPGTVHRRAGAVPCHYGHLRR